jgi:hypothetical protein
MKSANGELEGFVIDLLRVVSSRAGLAPEIHLVKDGAYGARDEASGKWSGMMGEVLRGVSSKLHTGQ